MNQLSDLIWQLKSITMNTVNFLTSEIVKSLWYIHKYTLWMTYQEFSDNEVVIDTCCFRIILLVDLSKKLLEIVNDDFSGTLFIEVIRGVLITYLTSDRVDSLYEKIFHDYSEVEKNEVWQAVNSSIDCLSILARLPVDSTVQ